VPPSARGFHPAGPSRRKMRNPLPLLNQQPPSLFGLCWQGSGPAPGPIPRPWAPGPRRQTDGAQSAVAPAPDLSWRTKCATYDGVWHGAKRTLPNYDEELINWNDIVPDTRMGPAGSSHHPRISCCVLLVTMLCILTLLTIRSSMHVL